MSLPSEILEQPACLERLLSSEYLEENARIRIQICAFINGETLRPTPKFPRVPVILLIILVVIFGALIVLGCVNSYEGQSGTPTVPPETGFVLDIPQKALLKNYVVVSAQTTPGTNCELVFIPPSGEIQKMEAVADDNGKCIWRWKLDQSLGKGHGRLIFTIDGKSETHFIEIRSNF